MQGPAVTLEENTFNESIQPAETRSALTEIGCFDLVAACVVQRRDILMWRCRSPPLSSCLVALTFKKMQNISKALQAFRVRWTKGTIQLPICLPARYRL